MTTSPLLPGRLITFSSVLKNEPALGVCLLSDLPKVNTARVGRVWPFWMPRNKPVVVLGSLTDYVFPVIPEDIFMKEETVILHSLEQTASSSVVYDAELQQAVPMIVTKMMTHDVVLMIRFSVIEPVSDDRIINDLGLLDDLIDDELFLKSIMMKKHHCPNCGLLELEKKYDSDQEQWRCRICGAEFSSSWNVET